MFIQVSTMQNHKILRWKLTSFILKVEQGAGMAFAVAIFRKGWMAFFVVPPPVVFCWEPFERSLVVKIDSTYKKIMGFYRKRLRWHPRDLLIYLNVLQRSCFEGFNSVGRSIIFIVHTTSQKVSSRKLTYPTNRGKYRLVWGYGLLPWRVFRKIHILQ